MEMAPRALSRPSKLPEQRLLSFEIHRWRRRSCRTILEKTPTILGFSIRRLFIGEGASSGVDQGQGARPGGGHPPSWWGYPLAPLRLSFSPCPPSEKISSFSLRFVQFQEYFLCSFSETQKQQKIGNWHCGILSIG
jgi:hypothetical protein